MFKEAEPGKKEVYAERTEQVLATGAGIVATACPFCMTMVGDGLATTGGADGVVALDIAELLAEAVAAR